MSAFECRETLAQSVARLDRDDACYFQERAADCASLAFFALSHRDYPNAITFQRAAAYFAQSAMRSLARVLEAAP